MKVKLEFATDGERVAVLEALARVFRLPEGDLTATESYVVKQLQESLRVQFIRGDKKIVTEDVLLGDKSPRNAVVERRASLAKANAIFGE